jgi:small subunit ribosomal protein S20
VANIKSQIKRNRTNEAARLRNKAAKSEVKTRIKTAVASAAAGAHAEVAEEDLRVAVKRLDKAAARGIIHRNQAANRKSRLMRRINALSAES